MTLHEMIEKKRETGLTCDMIAKLSGVPLGTVQKIFSGITKAPRKHTLDALSRALEPQPTASPLSHAPQYAMKQVPSQKKSGASQKDVLREAPLFYGGAARQPLSSIEDYYALPDDQRVELIDGVFYDMGAPSLKHQRILGDLYVLFRECVATHDMPCEVYLSPCDVRLDRDNYTMVQPDLLVICGEYDENAIRYEGAPDLVVEILSLSTRKKDLTLKLFKYQNAGVREYWVIDPLFRKVTVHYFEEDHYHPEQYEFDALIPVRISGGECEIDFSRVRGSE